MGVAKTVTVLGTGLMGAGMARNLARAGFAVTVWNRTREKALPLAEAGATVADDPVAAVSGADIVLTMLFDASAATEIMTRALPAMRSDAVWLQCGTVGIAETGTLAALSAEHGIAFLDAPVLGTKQPAEQGKLTVLVGGPGELLGPVEPVLDAIGMRTVWVGQLPGDGHRLKLVANAWVLSITAATAQSIALAGDLGLDGQHFLDVIAGGPLDSAYAQLKGKAMLAGEFTPAFELVGAAKDAGLIREAMNSAGTNDRLMTALRELYQSAASAGHGQEDMSAVITALKSD